MEKYIRIFWMCLKTYICILKVIFVCLFILKVLLDYISFGLVARIAQLSSKNQLGKHFIGNISDYYYLNPITHSPFQKNVLNSIEEFNYLNKDNNISKKNVINFSQNYDNKHLRKLESNSFCIDIFESFVRNKNRKLSYIFDLNYNIIRGLSIPILVVSFFVPISFIILNINNDKLYFVCKKKFKSDVLDLENECKHKCPGVCYAVQYILLIPWVSKFVLSLLLFYYIEKGDIEKYTEFLDCKYVNKDFFKKFDDIEKLVLIFEIFVFLYLTSEIINKITDFVELYLENAEYELNEKIKNGEESKSKESTPSDESNQGIEVKINN